MAMGPPPSDKPHEEWSFDHDKDALRYLGSTDDGATPAFYKADDHQIHHGEVDTEQRRVTADDDPARSLDEDESVGDYLADVHEDRGWDSLSTFGEEKLDERR